jgi:hypothetical protein
VGSRLQLKDCILPLVFLTRPSDVFEDEIGHLAQECGDKKNARELKAERASPAPTSQLVPPAGGLPGGETRSAGADHPPR